MLRGQIADIVVGSIFVFVGLATCAIAAFCRGRGVRVFVWLGIWSAMYGIARLDRSPAVIAASPRWLQVDAPYVDTVITYLLVVAGSLSFLELSLGRLRRLIQAAAVLAIAASGIFAFVFTTSTDRWQLYNNLLGTTMLLILVIVVTVLQGTHSQLPFRFPRLITIGWPVEDFCVHQTGTA